MLKLDSLSKNFGGLPALSEVSFQLQAGEMAFLTGHSGAGKSTLLHVLGWLDAADKGVVLYEGQDRAKLPSHERARLRNRLMGFVFQFYNLMASLTARENVALVTEIAQQPMTADDATRGRGHDREQSGRQARALGELPPDAHELVRARAVLGAGRRCGHVDPAIRSIAVAAVGHIGELFVETHAVDRRGAVTVEERKRLAAGIGGVGGLGDRHTQRLGVQAHLANETRCASCGLVDRAAQRDRQARPAGAALEDMLTEPPKTKMAKPTGST